MTIRAFVKNLEKTIDSSSIILSSNIQKHFGPAGETVYIRGHLLFVDSSILEIAIFATEYHNTLAIDKYRFHYLDNAGKMLFRYDNAPHHPEIASHPDHKHTPDTIIQSNAPSLENILHEISAKIIEQ